MQRHNLSCNPIIRSLYLTLIIVATHFGGNSCTATKRNIYFNDLPRDTTLHKLVTKDFELKIRKGDLIYIGVSSLSSEATAVFVAPQLTTGLTGNDASGFLVDMNGNIVFPKLGNLHAEGLTREELRILLMRELPPYLKEPVVTVNFVNHRVTVMGEVISPQVLTLKGERLTLLEALVLCGGLSKTARKGNVLVIRENGADKHFERLNLDNSSVFSSPFYYLRPDDIVYIEQEVDRKSKVTVQQAISYVSTGLSLLFLILSRRN